MTTLIKTETRTEAWLEAVHLLTESEREYNIILSINSPINDVTNYEEVRDRINHFYIEEENSPLNTVADTIFPSAHRRRRPEELWNKYSVEYENFKKGQKGFWGTYAHRLMHKKDESGKEINPLQVMIIKMQKILSNVNKYKSAYEINVSNGSFDIPLYDGLKDANRWYGGPCLSHLSFKLDDVIHLNAFYRSHDYKFKVPGNLLGLARLQSWVANKVGLTVGSLVVHSTDAWVGVGKGKRKFAKLIDDIDSLVSKKK